MPSLAEPCRLVCATCYFGRFQTTIARGSASNELRSNEGQLIRRVQAMSSTAKHNHFSGDRLQRINSYIEGYYV